MESVIAEILAGVQQQAGLGGWAAVVGSLGVIVMFAIRVFKTRWPKRFANLHPLVQLALPFLAAAAGSLIVGIAGALAAGLPLGGIIGSLVVTALGAGMTAVFGHHSTRAVGKSFDQLSAEMDPDYQPGEMRKKMSILVDMPKINAPD